MGIFVNGTLEKEYHGIDSFKAVDLGVLALRTLMISDHDYGVHSFQPCHVAHRHSHVMKILLRIGAAGNAASVAMKYHNIFIFASAIGALASPVQDVLSISKKPRPLVIWHGLGTFVLLSFLITLRANEPVHRRLV